MPNEYSEDNLIEQTAIDLFFRRLGWDTIVAFNKETFGEGSTLGRLDKKEVVLKKIFFEKRKAGHTCRNGDGVFSPLSHDLFP